VILPNEKVSTAMSFNSQRVNREAFHILSVGGYMGNDECCKLETELEHLLQHGHRHVIIDFRALTFITTASLLRVSKQLRRFERGKWQLRLANLPPFATRLMKIARLERALKPAVDLAMAIQSLSLTEPRAAKQKYFRTGKEFLPAANKKQTFAVEPS
jgi:anti-anti-sigma factor